ncbi:MAG: pyroglutamyl-peptidase I [Eubacteriales bacterium]|nr:pyroglutamyl-peptidase I [Eubacteriales bacterium]
MIFKSKGGDAVKKLLITGFEPFGGEKLNPSWEAVRMLPETIGDFALTKLQVPVVFGLAGERVLSAAGTLDPDVILCIGQAGGRGAVTPERIAINCRSASIPDNAGFMPVEEPVVKGGPDGLFATVPVEAMAAAIRKLGLPAAVSNTAGTYVCNDLMYTLLHHYRETKTRVGFLHVPYLPEQGKPSMELMEIQKALAAAVSALAFEFLGNTY